AAGAVGSVFEEIAVVLAESREVLRNRFVATRRDPSGAEIAAADMCRDRHVGGFCLERLVDRAGVGFLEVIDVEAALLGLLEFLLRAQIGPRRVVELPVA